VRRASIVRRSALQREKERGLRVAERERERVEGVWLRVECFEFRASSLGLRVEVGERRGVASGTDHARSLAPAGRVRRVASTLSCAPGIANLHTYGTFLETPVLIKFAPEATFVPRLGSETGRAGRLPLDARKGTFFNCRSHESRSHSETKGLYLGVERGGLREGYHESRRCSRDTYPESYITKYTSIRRLHDVYGGGY